VSPAWSLAQSPHATPATTGIDFRRTETLAWSLQLHPDSPDALHDVSCTHVGTDRYDCVGKDANEKTRTLHIRVSQSGTAWQTIADDVGHRFAGGRDTPSDPHAHRGRSWSQFRIPEVPHVATSEAPDAVAEFRVLECARLAVSRL
jgi:hypothetical protein